MPFAAKHLAGKLLLAVTLIGGGNIVGHATDVPMLPFPRIEVGAHIDRPVDLAFDPVKAQLISVSDDRTIRFWNRKNGRLIDTLRVPMSDRKEGELYAVAVAPKQRLLLVAGWTGYTWDRSLSVYVFDLESRQLLSRIEKLPERVTAMAFSHDESKLAVALINGETLLYSAPEFKLQQTQQQCENGSYRLHFSRDDQLAQQCFDGKVYIYDAQLNPLGHYALDRDNDGNRQAGSVHWSPNSQKFVVSGFNQQQVTIVDSQSLQAEHTFSPLAESLAPLQQVIWSIDQRYIYAAGDVTVDNIAQIIRWDTQTGEQRQFNAGSERVFRLLALPDGAIAYSTLDNAIGILQADGKQIFYQEPPIIQHLNRPQWLYVSEDASEVAFSLNDEGTRFQHFSVTERMISTGNAPRIGLDPPNTQAPDMRLKDWRFSKTPLYNEEPIALYPHQESNAVAISPDQHFFTLGLDREIRRYHKNGKLEWANQTAADVLSINISGDNKTVVASLSDGSLRWYRAEDGREFFAFFAHRNETDWVAWTPPGFFISSPDGDKFIGWQLNNNADETADFYSAWQFERLLYRPDIVADYFASKGIWRNSQQFEKFRSDRMRELAPPEVSISLLEKPTQGKARIRIESNKRNLPITQYTVFVNNLPVTPYAQRRLSTNEQNQFIREHEIPLSETDNTVRVEVLTENSFEVANLFIESEQTSQAVKGDLYLLAIGVNQLPLMPENNLNYAAQDASAVSTLLASATNLFNQVHISTLSDQHTLQPTKDNILQALSFLEQSTQHDTVILYIAAHGISNTAGDYFMVPQNGTREDLHAVINGGERSADSLIRWDNFFNSMRNASGRRMLIVDTCEAQKIKGNFDFGSLAKRSAAADFGLLSASTGDQQSQEYPPASQGLFTFALLSALQGQADKDQNNSINLEEVYSFTKAFVENNRLLPELPQTPQLIASELLRETVLYGIEAKSEKRRERFKLLAL